MTPLTLATRAKHRTIATGPTEYDAQILKLDLPEQDALKNDPERCSADPAMLQSVGRAVGHQVRIKRADDPRFVAIYTVRQANPQGDLSDPNRAGVVRTGQAGRERLGTPAEMEAVVQATVVDAAPLPGRPIGVRFFEVAEDDPNHSYFIAIAPHGGAIEERTDDEADHLSQELIANGYPASLWTCQGYGDELKGASDRWHITSTDLHPASFPRLQTIATRRFCYGATFHGFAKQPGDADLYIGGRASATLKRAIRDALEAANLPVRIKIATATDDPKFQGVSRENLINRLAVQGIHIEQSRQARKFSETIAKAIATVYQSRWRRFLCAWTSLVR
jgi:phage replication-related protein YjqB (UPF0714/DUF867 family)